MLLMTFFLDVNDQKNGITVDTIHGDRKESRIFIKCRCSHIRLITLSNFIGFSPIIKLY